MSGEASGEDAARRLRSFAALYVIYVGSVALLIAWVAITMAYFNGDWRVVLDFNRLGEGPLELVALTLVVTMLPLGWMALHETMRQA